MTSSGTQEPEVMPEARTAAHGTSIVSGKRVVLLVSTLVMCVLAYQLNASMITPALPDIARELNVSLSDVSQVSSLFMLFGSIGGIVLTRWSDYLGRKNMLLLILGCLLVGSVMAMFAPTLPVLLIGRALQGLSSASFQLAYLVLSEALDAKQFGVMLGVITAINGGVGGVDGYVGGLLTEHFGFRSLFVVIIGFVVIAGIGIITTFPKLSASSHGTFDWWGGAFLSVGVICLGQFISSVTDTNAGVSSARTWILLAVSLVAFAAFVMRESRAKDPLISLEELKSRQVWPLILAVLLTLAGVFAVINYTVVVFSQNAEIGFGMSASTSSLFFLVPPAVIGIVGAPAVGWLAPRIGWIRTLRIGLVICLVAIAVMTVFPTSLVVMVCCIVVLGVGYNAIALTTLNGLGVVLSPEASKGSLPAMTGACFGLGASLGIAFASPFASSGTVLGVRLALLVSFIITLLAFGSSLLMKAADSHQE